MVYLKRSYYYSVMTATKLIKDSWNLYKSNMNVFLPYIWVLFGVSILSLIVNFFIGEVGTIDQLIHALPFTIAATVLSFIGLWISLGLLSTIASIKKTGKTSGIKPMLTAQVKHLFPVILASLLTGLLVVAGFFIFIIPAIIFSIWFTFTTHAIVLDNKKVVESLKYSKSLVTGKWGEVFWLILGPSLAFVLPMLVLDKLSAWLVDAITSLSLSGLSLTGSIWGVNIITTLLILLITPLSTTALTLLYLDLKERT